MYRENPLKRRFAEGRRAFGCWLQLSHPAAAEMLALCGYDLVLIDMEHGPGTLPETANMLRAVAGTPAAAVVRVPANDPVFLKRLLDQGPDGVMIPMVETAAEAKAAVAACRYPPRGVRGWAAGVARASSYGLVADYTRTAHDNLFITCQIESLKGVENIDAIAAVDGVDMIFVGRNDLAANSGHILDLDNPEQDALLARIVAATRRAGKLIGTVPSKGLGWPELFARGFDMVLPSSDISMLRDKALAEIAQFHGLPAADKPQGY